MMILKLDFDSDEALYSQLIHQIIYGIAAGEIREGDSLPSVRQVADTIRINMHTVNKAYAILRQEGYLKLDRRRGAVICLNSDKEEMIRQLQNELGRTIAKAICKGISREELHQLVDAVYLSFMNS